VARGGQRPGSGRPRGAKSRDRAAIDDRLAELDHDEVAALVSIAKDPNASLDLKARVNIELMHKRHPTPRAEPAPRPVAIEGQTPEAKAASVFSLLASGALHVDQASQMLQGITKLAEVERYGVLADIVAKLAADRGIEVPAELRLRQKIPATLNQEPTP